MKKSNIFFLAMAVIAMCFSSFALTSCGDDDDDDDNNEIIIRPEKESKEFDKFYSNNASEFFTNYELGRNMSYVVNCREEFENIYDGTDELPDIDFDKNTLIIGKVLISDSGWYLDKQYIELGGELPIHKLIMRHSDGMVLQSFFDCYYYGIYPKLTIKELGTEYVWVIKQQK